jgi:tetratricopeptide (TPR) repeat protein
MAKELKDLVEQQRASTQLGRTFMDMYEQKDCVTALPKAKKYLSMAMELARVLKANPPVDKVSPSSFVVELVDAYNNLGMLKMVVEEPDVACKLLQQGLALCEEEEVGQTDAARTRLHHNLGRLHLEQRQWDLAMKHILKDIEICQDLPHPQGEAKGLNNLGEVHFKCQRYMDALQCYHRALNIVQKLQDEDHLLSIVQANIEVVQQAMPKMKEFQEALKQHSGLQKKVETAKGSVSERRLYQLEFKALQSLLAQAHELQAWEQVSILASPCQLLLKFPCMAGPLVRRVSSD